MNELLANLSAFDPVVSVSADYLSRFIAREGLQAATGAAPARQGQIAVIPIQGVLTPKTGRSSYGAWTGMETLRADLRNAGNDGEVSAVVLRVDSPGGTVAGTAETAAEVTALTEKKPVIAIADTLTASAALWIASQATEFVAVPGADVGSIAAMTMHLDISKALDDFGVKITMVRSGPNKNETAPFGPLSQETLDHLQSRVNDAGEDFIKAVAAGRRTSQANVRDNFGKGRVFSATQALKLGMIDRIATYDETISALASKIQARASRRRASALFNT